MVDRFILSIPLCWEPEFIEAFREAEILWWVKKRLDDYENADNFRCAREDMTAEVVEYKKIAEAGCCGSEDVTLDVPWEGKIVAVLYGFNYGH